MREIGKDAFRRCPRLKNIVFEEGSALEAIGNRAFSDCPKLDSVSIPAGKMRVHSQEHEDLMPWTAELIVSDSV